MPNDDILLLELKKMNKFLEAIDWKLWNMYNKFVEGNEAVAVKPTEGGTAPAPTAKTNATTAPAEEAQPVISVPKYPSIEEWK